MSLKVRMLEWTLFFGVRIEHANYGRVPYQRAQGSLAR